MKPTDSSSKPIRSGEASPSQECRKSTYTCRVSTDVLALKKLHQEALKAKFVAYDNFAQEEPAARERGRSVMHLLVRQACRSEPHSRPTCNTIYSTVLFVPSP